MIWRDDDASCLWEGEEEEESTVEPATPSLSIGDWVLVKYDSEEYPGRSHGSGSIHAGSGSCINQEYVSVSDRGDYIYLLQQRQNCEEE